MRVGAQPIHDGASLWLDQLRRSGSGTGAGPHVTLRQNEYGRRSPNTPGLCMRMRDFARVAGVSFWPVESASSPGPEHHPTPRQHDPFCRKGSPMRISVGPNLLSSISLAGRFACRDSCVRPLAWARHGLAVLVVPLLLSSAGVVFAQTVDTTLWVANGIVYSVVPDGGTIYIGGRFSMVGPPTGSAVAIDASTGVAQQPYPKVAGIQAASDAGRVYAIAPDGNGGWYLGGSFTMVRGQPRNYLAQLDAAGNLTPWDPNPNSAVRTLAVSGGTVYAGGYFTSIGGQPRNSIAALDATTGTATSWNPNAAGGYVLALAVSGATVYAGGFFGTIGGQTRRNIAALDATTGAATPWDPGASGGGTNPYVEALAVSGGTVYIGGWFATVAGQTRNNIAAIDSTTGAVTAWNPNAGPNPDVHTRAEVVALAVSGGTVYAGGVFTTIGGQPRNRVAALDATTGTATAWVPNPNGIVWALAVSGSTVYAGGGFTSIGGQSRNNLAALDATTGFATAWNPNVSDRVEALAVSGATVYAGGRFTTVGAQPRSNIAALDLATGAVTDWNPNPDVFGDVYDLAISGGTVYAGGHFTSIGGQPRNRIAALDAVTGTATAWDPNGNSDIQCLEVKGATVYVGGSFTTIGGQSRSGIAALDAATGAATPWDPNASATVRTLVVTEGAVYAGGEFTSIGGQPRNRIAALDPASGAATAWNPNADSRVNGLVVSGGTVYAGGFFTSIGGQPRNYIAALDVATGVATAWNPSASGGSPSTYVNALAVSGNTVYAGGSFTSIGGQPRNSIAALDGATAGAIAWDPHATGTDLKAIAVSGSTVYAGGSFHSIGGQPQASVAAISAAGVPVSVGHETPSQDDLRLVSANPTSAGTHVQYDVAHAGRVRLQVLDVSGRVEETLVDRIHTPGRYVVTWSGTGRRGRVSPGLYFVRFVAPGQTTMRKLAILQ